MIVEGEPYEIVVLDASTPVAELIVQVPPVTERTVVGAEPELPERFKVTVVAGLV